MTKGQIELATRAVACRAWRWMPGMLTTDGFRICRVDDDGYKFGWSNNSYAYRIPADVLPVLTDAATLGCLLALVREAWCIPRLACVPWRLGWAVDRVWQRNARLSEDATEAGALVAALEAAP